MEEHTNFKINLRSTSLDALWSFVQLEKQTNFKIKNKASCDIHRRGKRPSMESVA